MMKNMDRIFISHSSQDNTIATQFADHLRQRFGANKVWIDLYNLNIGSPLATTIPAIINRSKWFVLLASKASMQSNWVKYEANLATLLDIERDDFNIITIKLDECDFPPELELQLRQRVFETLNKYPSIDDLMRAISDQIATAVEGNFRPRKPKEPFIGRGREQDSIEEAAYYHKIIYINGIQGIGKSSLIKNTSASRFGRNVINIDLRRGHDIEMLSQQIIAETGNPPVDIGATDDELLETAIHFLRIAVNESNLLLLSSLENAIDTDGTLKEYAHKFIEKYAFSEIDFPLFLSTTRYSELTPSEVPYSTIVRLTPLEHRFMSIAIQTWYQYMNPGASSLPDGEIKELAENLHGYPLAAKLIAGSLSFENIDTLMHKPRMARLHQNIAESILNNISTELTELDQYILYSLSIYGSTINSRILKDIDIVNKYSHDDIDQSLSKLSRLMLLTRQLDSLILHPFIASYFHDMAKEEGAYKRIANSLADWSYQEAHKMLNNLNNIPKQYQKIGNPYFSNSVKSLFQVAVPTHRLLLIAGRHDQVSEIPYKFSGYLREMVFETYNSAENADDYELCIEYARRWLSIDPQDDQVRIHIARSYIRLEDYERAYTVLDQLEWRSNPVLRAQVYRERGRIFYQQDDIDEAIQHYEAARTRKHSGEMHYYQVNVDAARALYVKAERLWERDPEAKKLYVRAAAYLEEAKPNVPRFEKFHLDIYAVCLLKSDNLSIDEALEMLEEAHANDTRNGQIVRRLASLSLEKGNKDNALKYAEMARDLDAYGSILTLANVYIALNHYDKALAEIRGFDPKWERDRIVANIVESRIYTAKGEYEKARNVLSQYSHDNQYALDAKIQNELQATRTMIYSQRYNQAKQHYQEAEKLFNMAQRNYSGFENYKKQLEDMKVKLEE